MTEAEVAAQRAEDIAADTVRADQICYRPPEEPEPAIHAVQRIRGCKVGNGCEADCTCRATVEAVLRTHIPGSAQAALSIMRRIATMTEEEADFLDPHWWRDAARLAMGGEKLAVPIVYGLADRERAMQALIDYMRPSNIALSYVTGGEIIDQIATALGMTRNY